MSKNDRLVVKKPMIAFKIEQRIEQGDVKRRHGSGNEDACRVARKEVR